MALNRIQLTINSRMYTVVADEPPEYMEMLGEHINEKVRTVVEGGRNIMGERPMVLAALNICDEYYKLLQSKSDVSVEEMTALREENRGLREENNRLRAESEKLEEHLAELEEQNNEKLKTQEVEQSAKTSKELEEARTQIKFLEGQIKMLEEKSAKMKKEYERREQEIFDMFDNPSKLTGDTQKIPSAGSNNQRSGNSQKNRRK